MAIDRTQQNWPDAIEIDTDYDALALLRAIVAAARYDEQHSETETDYLVRTR